MQKKEIRGLQSQDYRFGFRVNDMKDIIAYCGVDCSLCDDYKNNSCPSCKITKWKEDEICLPVKCCREKEIEACAFCSEFPCRNMADFYDESDSHREAYCNMIKMRTEEIMIRQVRREEIPVCVDLIRNSFMTIADKCGFTEENAPRFTAFAISEKRLYWHMDQEHRPMFVAEVGNILCGYYSLLIKENGECELNNLAVLPEYRHRGLGKKLLDHSFDTARRLGCRVMNIGIVEENTVLRNWYEQNGAVHIGTKKFDFFPFTCGYMEKDLS